MTVLAPMSSPTSVTPADALAPAAPPPSSSATGGPGDAAPAGSFPSVLARQQGQPHASRGPSSQVTTDAGATETDLATQTAALSDQFFDLAQEVGQRWRTTLASPADGTAHAATDPSDSRHPAEAAATPDAALLQAQSVQPPTPTGDPAMAALAMAAASATSTVAASPATGDPLASAAGKGDRRAALPPGTQGTALPSQADMGANRRTGMPAIDAGTRSAPATTLTVVDPRAPAAPLTASPASPAPSATDTSTQGSTAPPGSHTTPAAFPGLQDMASQHALPVRAATVGSPVGSPVWAQDLGDQFTQQAVWQGRLALGAAGQHRLELRLNPAELGPLQITMSVHDGIAQAAFTSQHAAVRQAVESALPQLQQALANAGLSLGQASVGDGRQPTHEEQTHGSTASHRQDADEAAPASIVSTVMPARPQRANALLDTFA